MKKVNWKVTSPEGSEIIVKNLKVFCAENNLDDSGMKKVANGKIKAHKGWSCENLGLQLDEYQEPPVEYITSEGKLVTPVNIRYTTILNGYQYIRKDWKITDPKGNTFVIDNLHWFCKEYGLADSNMTAVAKGRLKQHKGYKCEYA